MFILLVGSILFDKWKNNKLFQLLFTWKKKIEQWKYNWWKNNIVHGYGINYWIADMTIEG